MVPWWSIFQKLTSCSPLVPWWLIEKYFHIVLLFHGSPDEMTPEPSTPAIYPDDQFSAMHRDDPEIFSHHSITYFMDSLMIYNLFPLVSWRLFKKYFHTILWHISWIPWWPIIYFIWSPDGSRNIFPIILWHISWIPWWSIIYFLWSPDDCSRNIFTSFYDIFHGFPDDL